MMIFNLYTSQRWRTVKTCS